MVVSEAIQKEIEEKIELYEAAKEKIKALIENSISTAVGRLEALKSELIDEVEKEFCVNPFAEFLSTDNSPTDADAKKLLAEQKIPESFGPGEKSFSTLLKDIDSLEAWRNFVPKDLKAKSTAWDIITLTWDEVADASSYQIEVDGSKSWESSTANLFTKRKLLAETEHSFRVRTVRGSSVSEWSDVVKERTLKKFSECAWRKCPDDVDDKRRGYSADEMNPRIATKVDDRYDGDCTITGDTPIPLNAVTSWSVKVVKSMNNDCYEVYVGVAPLNINQNDNCNYYECGWYFHCYDSTLYSGPPHSYGNKAYGPRKEKGQYVHTGDSVGVVMDTKNGELSFILSGVSLGVAFEEIPLDKPLVPCVLLYLSGDSVELVPSEVKEKVDSSISVPSNITANNITCDSIAFTWGEVSDASFYQVKVDGNKSWDATTTNTFVKRGLLPEAEHSFRVRAVRGSSVSKWSSVMKKRTLEIPEFSECVWRKCPDDVDDNNKKYSVDEENLRIATKINYNGWCTIIGNTHIPLNAVTSWSIKVLKSKYNDCYEVYVGVAPNDINQNNNCNCYECGWYFHCYSSALWSGPPYNYGGKEYGPRNEWKGEYVRTGDNVGVVMDITKGELSFIIDGVNLGVAYRVIPLDRPLVPCVILGNSGDSVELVV